MIIIDQHLQLVPERAPTDWGGTGSFTSVGKINQLSHSIRTSKLSDLNKLLILTDFDVSCDGINSSDVDLVIINFSDHPFFYLDTRLVKKPQLILHYSFKEPNYYPYHLVYSAFLAQSDLVDFSSPRPHTISSINGKPRISRIYAMLELSKQNWFSNVLITWRKVSEYNPVPDWDLNEIQFSDITKSEWTQIESMEQNCLPDTPILTEELSCASIGPGFTNSYMTMVTEASCEDNGFLTEKIFKPIRAGQLFVVQGPPGAIDFLRSMGFDVFDDYINHHNYDNILNWQERTRAVIQTLSEIQPHVESVWFATVDRRIKNAQWLKSTVLYEKCMLPFEI